MPLQLYDTLAGAKRPFETIEPGAVRLYVCGVTVYDRAHVGHAMCYLVFDTIRRWLEYRGYDVRHVQNFTDVDDKIIRRSLEEGVSAYEIADRYAHEFIIDMERLGVLRAHIYPRVSSEMPQIVRMVEQLVADESAYVGGNGDVYFDVSTKEDYGKLSRRTFEGAESQTADDPEAAFKHNPADFALWKSAKPGEPAWDSPWGPGRPGWHIECSAMARQHLGEEIDIHGGGLDLKFPHHENEIAQTEAACGCARFAHFWVHNGLVQFDGDKMSKSLGNVWAVGDFLDAHEGEALRLFVHSGHYRKPTTLTPESLNAAERGLARLRGALRPARGADAADEADRTRLAEATTATRARFEASMDDDFGTPDALAALFEYVTEINRAREAGVGPEALGEAQCELSALAGLLGYDLPAGYAATEGGGADAAPFVDLLVQLRNEARVNKDWAMADRLRDTLAEHGVTIEDSAEGTTWRMA